jgi:glycine cleavage system H lipoate-binding protein
MKMSNQVSSQYTHIPDSLSLDGLDDFLCGLIDELFHVEAEGPQETISNRAELAQIEQDIFEEIENSPTSESGNVVSALPGLFARSSAAAQTLEDRPSLFEGDSETNNWILRVKLLESQLDYRNKELQESLRRMRWLETELASRENQIKYLPELLKRSIDATRYELELDDIKLKLEFLSSELTSANNQLDTIKSNWLGKLSLWLASKKADMDRTETPIAEASD